MKRNTLAGFSALWQFLNIGFLALAFFSSGCGRIWGSVTWQNGGRLASNVFNYTCSYQGFLIGIPVNSYGPIAPGTGLTYSISPALPTGLSFNSSTGAIIGTPTTVTSSTAYTVTATLGNASAKATIYIQTDSGYLVNDLVHDSDTAGAGCTSGFGTCTLRAAIDSPSPPNMIILPQGSAVLTLGQISMDNATSIYGDCSQGTTVDGNNSQIIFVITDSTGTISFNNMTIQNAFGNNVGGPAFNISNSGVAPTFTVAMNNLLVQHNIVVGPGPGGQNGGAIVISGNSLAHQAILSLNQSTFFNNQDNSTNTPFGGVMYFAGHFTQGIINNCAFIQNSTPGAGGVIVTGARALSVTNSLFYNNSGGIGGALGDESSALGNIVLTNDTFDSNSANFGGVIAAQTTNFPITNCTFVNNSDVNVGSGVFYINGGSTSVGNSLFENNMASGVLGVCGAICNVNSTGYNLTDSTVGDGNFNQTGDIVNTAALLGSLQNNGGLTQTTALLTGSAGINQASTVLCPSTDQRGYARHLPSSCDIGAYEHEP